MSSRPAEKWARYEKRPVILIDPAGRSCFQGWEQIAAALGVACRECVRSVLVIECYPGVSRDELHQGLAEILRPELVLDSEQCFREPAQLEALLAPDLGADPVFGRLSKLQIQDFLCSRKAFEARRRIEQIRRGLVVVYGTGASLLAPDPTLLVYADLARWEIQQRQRRNQLGNLGAANQTALPAEKYKRAFFVDWRAADRLKKDLFSRLDFFLDTNLADHPKMVRGEDLRSGLARLTRQPFRLVPFFDPGPWGGQWMRRICGLNRDEPNFAWCFDGVPEENSLLLGFGGCEVELPAQDLVLAFPRELLGDAVYRDFGTDFPIRFDFLDTMGGGNLSLQVHPAPSYIREHFGLNYTQDESYYLLDAGADAAVYLGVREGVDPKRMQADLERAQAGGYVFPAEDYINIWPARKHDHFLIPSGTVHCSGRNCMVLEISATPYIFTFKLWDWDRPGLDGRPRPIHLDHGIANINWDRTTEWVSRELINRIEPLLGGKGWREEKTGLHELEFIETRRHWFSVPVNHPSNGGVNVLNLVEGDEAIVESSERRFAPFEVHYAETWIMPAAAGPFSCRPSQPGHQCATVKAFVKNRDK